MTRKKGNDRRSKFRRMAHKPTLLIWPKVNQVDEQEEIEETTENPSESPPVSQITHQSEKPEAPPTNSPSPWPGCSVLYSAFPPPSSPPPNKYVDTPDLRFGWTPWQSRDFLTELLSQPSFTSHSPPSSSITSLSPPQPPPVPSLSTYSSALKVVGPPVPPPPQQSTSFPLITITPLRYVNFLNIYIQFQVSIVSSPFCRRPCQSNITATAYSPVSATPIACVFYRRKESHFCGPATFQGSFMPPASQTGLYTIKIRFQHKTSVYTTAQATVLVCRNYFKDSLSPENKSLIQLPATGLEEQKDEKGSNFWGLACNPKTGLIYFSEGVANAVTCIDISVPGGCTVFRVANLNAPAGLCCDLTNNRLVICERGAHRLTFVDLTTGAYLSSLGGPGDQPGQFHHPWSVSLSPCNSFMAVSDLGNHRIQVFSLTGDFLKSFPCPNPCGVLVTGGTTASHPLQIYVTNWLHGYVTEILSQKKFAQNLSYPQGLAMDKDGTLLVCSEQCVRHYYPGGGGADISGNGDGDKFNDQLAEIHYVAGTPIKFPVNLAILPNDKVCLLLASGKLMVF